MEASPRVKRKVWHTIKIEALQARVAQLELEQKSPPANGNIHAPSYAQGVYDAMCKYQLLSKMMRKRIRDGIISSGYESFSRQKNPWKF